MVLPELGNGLLVGIGFGLLGISFWVIGLFIFYKLFSRSDAMGAEDG